jgi:hypothetical protein
MICFLSVRCLRQTQLPVPRRGDVAKRSASEPCRGNGI